MASYYVSDLALDDGRHEVHQYGCKRLFEPGHSTYLGEFDTCWPAVEAAKRVFPQSNGCRECVPDCHTS